MDLSNCSKLRWIALPLTCIIGARTAVACFAMPATLARPHAKVIAEAKQILWAEVIGSQSIEFVEEAQKAVRYKLRVLRVLKGQAGSTVELDGEGDLSGIWDTTFADHAEEGFWKSSSGRMGVEGDCSMVPPLFVIGKRYVVMISPTEDTKQFERVDNEGDRWLKYVESHAAPPP